MNITITGTIKQIFNSEVFGSFEKRTFWVEETTDRYPNTYQLEMQQGECNRLDGFKAGDQVECSVDVKGKWWNKNGKEGVINTLKCWKLVKQGQKSNDTTMETVEKLSSYGNRKDIPAGVNENIDDLPF